MYKVEFKQYGGVVVASVYTTRFISISSDSELGDEIIAYLRENPGSHILLNFTDVDYISSARLTELLKINDVLLRQNGSMRICGLNDQIRKVFTITKLDTIFQIEGDCRSCLKKYRLDLEGKADS